MLHFYLRCVSVQLMYQAMVECQALHPDPEDIDSEDEFADYNEDEEDGEENGDGE